MADFSLLCAIIERDAGRDSPSNPTKVEVWRPPCWRSLCFGRTNQKSFWGVLQSNHCIFFDLENLAIGWKMTVFQPLFQYRSGKTGIIEVSPVFSRKIRLAASMPPPLARRAFSSDNSRTSRQCPDFLIESWGKFGKIHFAANIHIHNLIIY